MSAADCKALKDGLNGVGLMSAELLSFHTTSYDASVEERLQGGWYATECQHCKRRDRQYPHITPCIRPSGPCLAEGRLCIGRRTTSGAHRTFSTCIRIAAEMASLHDYELRPKYRAIACRLPGDRCSRTMRETDACEPAGRPIRLRADLVYKPASI